MHEKPKSYIGSGMFGKATDSYDLDGTTTAEEKIVTPFTSDERSEEHTSELQSQ